MAVLLSMWAAPTGYRKHNEVQNISHRESHTLMSLKSVPDWLSEVPAGDRSTLSLTAEWEAHPLDWEDLQYYFLYSFEYKGN